MYGLFNSSLSACLSPKNKDPRVLIPDRDPGWSSATQAGRAAGPLRKTLLLRPEAKRRPKFETMAKLTTLICTHLKEEQGVQIPNDALCPNSLEVIEDPVMCTDGQSYERAAITKWLKKNHAN